jgi:branched-chain amino acid transport system ATP-binding protein
MGGTLSGGEQQMLAIARGLMLRPRLLMLDEPSLGLAPIMAENTFEKIDEIHREGISILLVEQNVMRALTLVQRGYILSNGQIVLQGTATDLLENEQVKDAYLGL